MKWRLLWEFKTPDFNSPEPQAGVGEYVYESFDEAFLFVEKHYQNIMGMPETSWTAESDGGDFVSYRFWKESGYATDNADDHHEGEGELSWAPDPTMLEQVREFHRAFNIAIDQQVSDELLSLRMRLITEESCELMEAADQLSAATQQDSIAGLKAAKAHFQKELCDLLYVALGAGISFGMPLERAFQAVHASNMSKLGADGKPIMRADGKVLKGPNYHEAYLLDLTY